MKTLTSCVLFFLLALTTHAAEPLTWGALKPAADEMTAIVNNQWLKILEESRVGLPKGSTVSIIAAFNARGEAEIQRVEDGSAGKQAVFTATNAITYPQPYSALGAALKLAGYQSVKALFIFRLDGKNVRVTGAPLEIVAGTLPEVEEPEAAAERARADYLRAHPELPTELVQAINGGKLLAGMNWDQAKSALGRLGFEAKSEGVGGTVESWSGRDKFYRYTLYFSNGLLLRWSTLPLY